MKKFALHNNEVSSVWDAYRSGKPSRMPMLLSFNVRMALLDPRYCRGVTFEQYYSDPRVMIQAQCDLSDLMRQNLYQDWEMGERESYNVYVDFQNNSEALLLGAELRFPEDDVPFTIPFITEDNRNILFERGVPDHFGSKAWSYYEYMKELEDKGALFNGKPIHVISPPGMGTDGPMTLACILRGATGFCLDLYIEPEWSQKFLTFLTESVIRRVKACRRRLNLPERSPSFGFADDSIQLISTKDYKELILPHHKRLIQELSTGEESNSIHLCGDASRHFPVIRDELNVMSFDTGFPIDHGALARELGPDVEISGGVHVNLLRNGTPEHVADETLRIINAVKPHTRKFVMKEANNLAPETPFENVRAMYETVREFGVYS